MARKDEVKVSKPIVKYMKFLGSHEDGRYVLYEFTDESGNVALHYQLNPELINDKKAKGQARLWQTKAAKLNIGDIAIVVCKCREVLEPGYEQSVMYLNADKIVRSLVKYETVSRLYNGIMTEFVKEVPITSWDDIRR